MFVIAGGAGLRWTKGWHFTEKVRESKGLCFSGRHTSTIDDIHKAQPKRYKSKEKRQEQRAIVDRRGQLHRPAAIDGVESESDRDLEGDLQSTFRV